MNHARRAGRLQLKGKAMRVLGPPRPPVEAVVLALLIAWASASAAQAGAIDSAEAHAGRAVVPSLVGITAPFREAVVGCVQQGKIVTLSVPEGETVRSEQPLFRLDDSVQQARVRLARHAAEATCSVDLARAEWQRADAELRRLQRLYGADSASSKELVDATADAEEYRLRLEMAGSDLQQARLAFEREQAVLDELTVRAPFDAYVAEHLKQPGEVADVEEGVVRIAQLDPLLVVADCPLEHAPQLAAGDSAQVVPVFEHWPARTGRVVLVNRVADGGSQTFRVKLAVDNADGLWPAGMKVRIDWDATADHSGEPGHAAANEGVGTPDGLRPVMSQSVIPVR